MVSIVIGFPFSDKHASLSGASWPLAPGNPSILPFLLSIQRFLPSLTGSTPGSERLSLIRSGEVLQQPRCALRGLCDPQGPRVPGPTIVSAGRMGLGSDTTTG